MILSFPFFVVKTSKIQLAGTNVSKYKNLYFLCINSIKFKNTNESVNKLCYLLKEKKYPFHVEENTYLTN